MRNLKPASIYCLIFILVFDLFYVETFADNDATKYTFWLMSFLASIVIVVLFVLFKRIFKGSGSISSILLDFLVLYLLSELTIFCFTGELCVFGVFYKFHIINAPINDSDMLPFREKRDFAFSMSFLIAAVIGFLQAIIFKPKPTDNLPPSTNELMNQ